MAWRGLVRTLEAGVRRAELAVARRSGTSESARRHYDREVARLERRKAKLLVAERATDDVQRYEQYVRLLIELHKDCLDEWDWQDILRSQQPPPPALTKALENAARHELDAYRPGLLARIFGSPAKRVSALTQAVEIACSSDGRKNAELLDRYKAVVTTWDIERRIASRVLARDPGGYQEALSYVDVLSEFGDLDSRAWVTRAHANLVVVNYEISDRETIPSEGVELNALGKVLSKPLPVERYWTLYQNHACSAALRIARDVFNVIPVGRVIVNVSGSKLAPATGQPSSKTILAVCLVRSLVNQLGMVTVNPIEVVTNSQHRMNFDKAVGFEPIDPLTER